MPHMGEVRYFSSPYASTDSAIASRSICIYSLLSVAASAASNRTFAFCSNSRRAFSKSERVGCGLSGRGSLFYLQKQGGRVGFGLSGRGSLLPPHRAPQAVSGAVLRTGARGCAVFSRPRALPCRPRDERLPFRSDSLHGSTSHSLAVLIQWKRTSAPGGGGK